MNRRNLAVALAARACVAALPAASPSVALAQWTPGTLTGTAWTLMGIAYPDGGQAAAEPGRYTIAFDESGQAWLRLDCNSGFAGWSVSGDSLTITGAGSTLMLCPNADPLEPEFGRLISEAAWWSLDGGTLTITTAGGATMTFQRTATPAP